MFMCYKIKKDQFLQWEANWIIPHPGLGKVQKLTKYLNDKKKKKGIDYRLAPLC